MRPTKKVSKQFLSSNVDEFNADNVSMISFAYPDDSESHNGIDHFGEIAFAIVSSKIR